MKSLQDCTESEGSGKAITTKPDDYFHSRFQLAQAEGETGGVNKKGGVGAGRVPSTLREGKAPRGKEEKTQSFAAKKGGKSSKETGSQPSVTIGGVVQESLKSLFETQGQVGEGILSYDRHGVKSLKASFKMGS